MNDREQRGLELAQTVNIRPMGKGVGKWTVPSATSAAHYTVDLNSKKRCTCPDFELRRCKCKHVYAVEYVIRKQRETVMTSKTVNGETTKTKTITETITVTKRPTYSQNWPAYNAAQVSEKAAANCGLICGASITFTPISSWSIITGGQMSNQRSL